MTPEQVVTVVSTYAEKLAKAGVKKESMDPDLTLASLSSQQHLAHAYYLCDGVIKRAQINNADWADGRKVGSHLTSIQYHLSLAGWYTLEELKDHNRQNGKSPE